MFSKKYNFKEREEHWKGFWKENEIYKFDENSQKPVYSVDTPPPYVSAEHLHAGHIMSYSQAEFVVRFKRMQGYNVFYPMGFDDNGLPTERYVEKKYDVDKSKVSRSEFIDLCLKETKKGSQNYKNLWTDLGISVDWSKTYSTINSLCQRISQKSFIDLFKENKIYKKRDPIQWCPFCETALSQADVEDKEQKSKINYIVFSSQGEKYSIATTRPELIPACVSLFAHPEDKRYSKLKGQRFNVPLFNYEVPLLFDESVDPEFGSGLMMVCTWGDIEDVKKFKELNLPSREVINSKGRMTELAGKYKGLRIAKAREKMLEDLDQEKLLVKQENIDHTVNVHERCNTPVEFISSDQWFIKILDIKDKLIEMGERLNWYPEKMKIIYHDWIDGLKWDWCISRQRYYGVPFPVWYCQKCGEIILPKEEDLPVDPTEKKPSLEKCPQCESKKFKPEESVMDTWATSSCTPFIIRELVENKDLKDKIFPNSLRPQAFEIIRTWLFYSIVKSFYHFNDTPFHDVMISGHGLDEKGNKISKRLGNYVEPNKLLNDFGADAIRYWATGATLGQNHRFELREVKKGKHLVTKIWNAAKFCSMNIGSFKPKRKKYNLDPEDKWILNELNQTIKKTTCFFEKYEYAKARKTLDDFFWATFCDYYLEMIKHRSKKEAVQYTLYYCLFNIIKLYAPIIPFVTEEIYQEMFEGDIEEKSIHQTGWPEPNQDWTMDKKEAEEIDCFIQEIDAIRKEKADKKLRFKDVLEDYSPKTKVNLDIFKKKLEKMLFIKFNS